MVTVFWISIFLLFYTYLLYPAVLYLWANVASKRVRRRYHSRPLSVVLVVPAEEDDVGACLETLRDQDYPADLVEVIVVADGSDTRHLAELADSKDPRLRLIHSEAAMGTAWAMNTGVQNASHDIVLFIDRGQCLRKNAFAEIAAMFEDPNVGAVTGELVTAKRGRGPAGIGNHRQYENFILQMESDVDSVLGANGAVFAIRRQLFSPLPLQTALHDFVLFLRIARKGFRIVFARSVRAWDATGQAASQEYTRAVRTLAGNFQALLIERASLNPWKHRLFFQVVSHRITRLAAPYFAAGALVSNLFLGGVFFKVILVAQFVFYATVLLRFTPLVSAPLGGFIRVAWAFTVHNAAAVMGLWVFLRDNELEWNRTRT